MCVSIFAAICLMLYERHVVARTGSVAVTADATHYFGDVVSNVGVVVAIVLASRLGWILTDPIIALLVALVLVVTAWGVFRQSFDQLMDRELPDADREKIVSIVRDQEEVRALHELKTRQSGGAVFIQVHLELDPDMSLAKAHAISDKVEQAICATFPHAEVIIHQDPAGAEPAPDRVIV
jgi:ferrous-iron efflux pump FieF